ncbi:hypothetical protein M3484_14995 [Pseudomonas sp. GX19020]|uniref:hypothetical protein n=1 Tax=Pseudomonas sp. GX19020 TaxID=2942277 RepID=UPI0020185391|nr:hypothetical protein [Pseudomonas sp. GX19020]MCL4067880.1 hypothetical protein [Pseudomonas sp. GX19020]
MIHMTLSDAMLDGCRAVGIEPPRKTITGQWVKCPVTGKARSNTSGRVMIFGDETGGIAWNWATGEQHTFRVGGEGFGKVSAPRRDPEAPSFLTRNLPESYGRLPPRRWFKFAPTHH